MPLMTTFEHAVLTAQDFVYAADFDWLIEQNFIGFAVQRSRGTWQLVVGHYLGVIQLPSGTVLEVLPKIAQFSEVNLGETRAWVKTMLATIWPGLNPKQLPVIAPQTRFDHAQESIPMWLGQCFYLYRIARLAHSTTCCTCCCVYCCCIYSNTQACNAIAPCYCSSCTTCCTQCCTFSITTYGLVAAD